MQKPRKQRSIRIKFGELAHALGKGTIAAFSGNLPGAVGSVLDAAKSLGLKPQDTDTIAWLLVQGSLLKAMFDLIEGCLPRKSNPELNFKQLFEQLDWALERVLAQTTLIDYSDFFKHPQKLAVLTEVQTSFRRWLRTNHISEESAQAHASQLPRYFVFALYKQWQACPKDNTALQQHQLGTSIPKAYEQEQAWIRHEQWLKKAVDQPIFDEPFNLRQVYISLRAYYKPKLPSPARRVVSRLSMSSHDDLDQRIVVDLDDALTQWIERADKEDALRIICGGPGHGKSSFCRMFAARVIDAAMMPILFIPLHELRLERNFGIVDALSKLVQEDIEERFPLNPLTSEHQLYQPLLLIFDGLDELSMRGKSAIEVAHAFLKEMWNELDKFNKTKVRILALLSSRDVIVQKLLLDFDENFKTIGSTVFHILPYWLTKTDREIHRYDDTASLLETDQRQQWWLTYGQLKGRDYEGLPQVLDQEQLVEFTAQPLLNYLVAWSYDEGKLDFSENSNLNKFYEDILARVYKRDWEAHKHPELGEISLTDFNWMLEEIAVACWHGNGRTTAFSAVEKCCKSLEKQRILNIFRGQTDSVDDRAKLNVTRLLTAFYFRQSGHQDDELTFEFTHKSFGEYLTARRIVRQLELTHERFCQHQAGSDLGWDKRECLKQWMLLLGQAPLDDYLLSFLRAEVALEEGKNVKQWQKTLCELFGEMMKQGMPLEKIENRTSFWEELRQANHSGETLLATLNACALVSQKVSTIDWLSQEAMGTWLARLQGQRISYGETPLVFSCLGHLDLSERIFIRRDLAYANLSGANLSKAILMDANLSYANLGDTNLSNAFLIDANLSYANLGDANLSEAFLIDANLSHTILINSNFVLARLRNANLSLSILRDADLSSAILQGANLDGTDLKDANLSYADLRQAILTNAKLHYANLTGADLKDANLSYADLSQAIFTNADLRNATLSGANLTDASLKSTDLTEVDLSGTNLIGVNINGATLISADLSDADLSGADLSGADLSQAVLANTKMLGVSGLTPEQVISARFWESALIDKSLRQTIERIIIQSLPLMLLTRP